MKNLIPLTTFFTLTLLLAPITRKAMAQEKGAANGSIKAAAGSAKGFANISIFADGKLIAVEDARDDSWITFEHLPLGTYEIRFECAGFTTITKRTLLRDGGNQVTVVGMMTKGDGSIVLGPGPSIQELEARIRKLEEARK